MKSVKVEGKCAMNIYSDDSYSGGSVRMMMSPMESNPKIRDNMGDYYQDKRDTLYFMVIQR